MEHTLARMVCVLLALWLVSWTPYACIACWAMFFGGRGLTPGMAIVPTVMCKLSGTLNAFVYGVRWVYGLLFDCIAHVTTKKIFFEQNYF